MTAPYVNSPGNQFLRAFQPNYAASAQGVLGAQARQEQEQLELRRMQMDQAQSDRQYGLQQQEFSSRERQTSLGNALARPRPDRGHQRRGYHHRPTHRAKAHPRWIGLAGTGYSQDWQRTPDYATQTTKANQSTENNALGNALAQVGAPAGVIAAARSGTLPKESATQYLSQSGAVAQQGAEALNTARATAQYREAPPGTVMAVPTDPTNPLSPTRQMLVDPRTGRAKPIMDQAGQPLFGGAKGVVPPNATDRKDAALAGSVNANMGAVDAILGGPRPPSPLDLSMANHWFSRPFASSAAKQVQNAGGMAAQDIGHLKAGARLPPPEFARAYNSFIPRWAMMRPRSRRKPARARWRCARRARRRAPRRSSAARRARMLSLIRSRNTRTYSAWRGRAVMFGPSRPALTDALASSASV